MRQIFLIFLCLTFVFVVAQNDIEFVPNKGQFHENVLYRANIPSGALFLEKDGMTFSLYNGEIFHEIHHGVKVNVIHFHAYKIKFEGANLESTTKLNHFNKGVLNYFLGKDSSKWATGLKGGGEVYYKDLYEGIDFKIYTKNGSLKYDFIVHSGVEPKNIKMTYHGLDGLSKRGDDLSLVTSLGTITDSEPVAFQNKEIIDVSFSVKENTVGFEVGKYDSNEDIIIDPTLIFSTYSGSFANNFGYTATFDDNGNLYAGGSVFNQGYPTTIGAFDVSFNSIDTLQSLNGVQWGVSDIGITKYSADGTSRIYSTYIGGDLCEVPHSLIVNNRDELFILGTTGSSDYPTTQSAFNRTFSGGSGANLANGIFINYINGSDIILSRLSSDGSSLLASTYVGGSSNDGLNLNMVVNYADQFRGEIILDEFQNVVVGTSTFSSDFPTTSNSYETSIGGDQDGVVFKIDDSLNSMIWSSYFGGQNNDAIYSLIKSNSNDFYVAGGTMSMDLNFPIESFQPNYQGGITDGYYAKFSGDGNSVIQGSYVGSDEYDQIYFIREDKGSQIYLFGQSAKFGTYWVKDAAFNVPNSGQFISKLSQNQEEMEWSTTFGSGNGLLNISPTAFMVDLCNKVYLSGWGDIKSGFHGTQNMPLTIDAFDSTSLGEDFYLMVLESDASSLVYGSYFGGDESGEHVDGGTSRFDEKGIIYQSVCAGCGGNNDFPIKPSDAAGPVNNSSCNNGIFKFDFGIPMIVADFEISKSFCLSDSIFPINDSKILNATSFLWDFGDGTFSTDSNPSHFYNSPDTYEIVLTIVDSTACNFSDSVSKNIVVEPIVKDLKVYGDSVFCNSLPKINLRNETDSNLIHHWSNYNNFTDTILYGLNEYQINFQSTLGENYVFLKVSNSANCFSVDSLFIGAYEFDISYQTNLETCLNDSIEVSPGGFENYDSVYFSWGPSPLLTTSVNDTNAVFHGFIPGVYSVPVISTSAYSCTDTDYVNITVGSFDTASAISLTTNFETLINNQTAILTAVPEGLDYVWSPIESIINTFENNAEVGIEESTLFTVEINDPKVGNCFRRDSVLIVFIDSHCEAPYVYVPNAFSPNGDGENDVLYVRGRNITDVYFAIFNRWGEKVFETRDQSIGWDGSFRNKNSDPAVFDYYLQYQCEGGIKYFQKGNITLIR